MMYEISKTSQGYTVSDGEYAGETYKDLEKAEARRDMQYIATIADALNGWVSDEYGGHIDEDAVDYDKAADLFYEYCGEPALGFMSDDHDYRRMAVDNFLAVANDVMEMGGNVDAINAAYMRDLKGIFSSQYGEGTLEMQAGLAGFANEVRKAVHEVDDPKLGQAIINAVKNGAKMDDIGYAAIMGIAYPAMAKIGDDKERAYICDGRSDGVEPIDVYDSYLTLEAAAQELNKRRDEAVKELERNFPEKEKTQDKKRSAGMSM